MVIPTTIKTLGGRTLAANDDANCAQALRPTFGGWGPKL
jgi:hypothetical protein